jgi:hypothetical protein
MKCTRLLLLLITTFTGLQLQAQKFEHGVGIDIRFPERLLVSTVEDHSGSLFKSSAVTLTRIGFSYFPRVSFASENRISFSIGMPASLGIGLASSVNNYLYLPNSGSPKNFGNKNNSTRFAAEIPVVADIDFRAFSKTKNTDHLWLFLGGGYEYSHASFKVTTDIYNNIHNIDVYQPYFHAGIRALDKRPITVAVTFRPAKQYAQEQQPAATWGVRFTRRL